MHISGHTVERGIVKTAEVRLGRNVTVGLGSVIDIDVEVGDACEIGALSLVPKRAKLERGAAARRGEILIAGDEKASARPRDALGCIGIGTRLWHRYAVLEVRGDLQALDVEELNCMVSLASIHLGRSKDSTAAQNSEGQL